MRRSAGGALDQPLPAGACLLIGAHPREPFGDVTEPDESGVDQLGDVDDAQIGSDPAELADVHRPGSSSGCGSAARPSAGRRAVM